MRNSDVMRVVPLACALVLVLPASAPAWGYEAHMFIMERALALLPRQLRPLFEAHRAAVIERSIDPDTWRNAGFGDAESPNHFLNLDWEGYGRYPFRELPRDYTVAIARFGKERIDTNGTLPWRIEEMYGNLRRAFESYVRRGPFGRYDILHYAAWLGHYVSDAYVPFHAVTNYDGQLTNQHGIHARFESILFERYRQQLTVAPKPIAPMRNPRDFAFERLLEGTQLVPAILEADRQAIGARQVYDEAYYTAFFTANRGLLERRLSESIAAVAAAITGAWEAAGRPPVPLRLQPPPQRRR
jgi:hypothetical protein